MATEAQSTDVDDISPEDLAAAVALTTNDELETVKEFLAVRLELDQVREVEGALTRKKEVLQNRITELLCAKGIKGIEVDGYRFRHIRKPYPRVLPAFKDQAIAALQAMGLGDRVITVQPQAMQSLLREWIETDSFPESFKPFCETFERVSLSVTKVPAAKRR